MFAHGVQQQKSLPPWLRMGRPRPLFLLCKEPPGARSRYVRQPAVMPRTVSSVTDFGSKPALSEGYNGTEVCPSHENKALAQQGVGTKVTGRFGPGSANIKPDCVIP